MLILSSRHLEVDLREYVTHYNEERPHRSLELRPPDSRTGPPRTSSRCARRQGGVCRFIDRGAE